MDMQNPIRSSVMAAICVAVASTAFADPAAAGPVNIAGSYVNKAPWATEQIYYRRYGGYYRRGYAYGRRRYYGYPAYGYPAYGYGYPVVPVPLPVPFFGW
jgi:hypothetical protein